MKYSPSYPEVPPPMIDAGWDGSGLPEKSGIYFVWDGDSVVYVGQSTNLNSRVRAKNHAWVYLGDKISWLEIPSDDLFFHETYFIGLCRGRRNSGSERHKERKRRKEANLALPVAYAQSAKSEQSTRMRLYWKNWRQQRAAVA